MRHDVVEFGEFKATLQFGGLGRPSNSEPTVPCTSETDCRVAPCRCADFSSLYPLEALAASIYALVASFVLMVALAGTS